MRQDDDAENCLPIDFQTKLIMHSLNGEEDPEFTEFCAQNQPENITSCEFDLKKVLYSLEIKWMAELLL